MRENVRSEQGGTTGDNGKAGGRAGLRTWASLLACAGLAACAVGQAEAPRGAPSAGVPATDDDAPMLADLPARSKLSFFVEGGGRYSSPSELDGTDTEVSVARLRAALGVSYRVAADTDLIFRVSNEFSFYEFDHDGAGAPGIIPGMPSVEEPFDSVRATTISPILRVTPATGWNWSVGGRVTSAGEPGADFGDTIAAGGFVMASYDIAENLRLGAGVNVVTRLEGGVFVFPIPVIQWDITEQLRVGTIERGVGLSYAFRPAWRAGLEVGFMRREYALADDNAIPEGTFTDQRVPITLSLTYSPDPRTVIAARVGSEVWGDLEFNDRNENEVASYDLSPTLLVGLDVWIAF